MNPTRLFRKPTSLLLATLVLHALSISPPAAMAAPSSSKTQSNQNARSGPKSPSEVRRAGIEVEYAQSNRMEPKAENMPDEAYTKPLEIVRRRFRDRQGHIAIKPWTKYTDRNARYAEYIDPEGREWKMMPESVNTTGLDGLEFVSPPMDKESDNYTLQRILKDLSQSNLEKGVRSGVHVTLDVSDFIAVDGNASKLVDLILMIESHWAEIYGAVHPERYGTIINRFGVPLAVDQAPLLEELAQLPKEQRTLDRVRAIFQKYQEREIALKKGDVQKAWKYRAANYGKLFGLVPGGKQLSVLEFRIPDFGDPKDIMQALDFFRALVDAGKSIKTITSFRSPFAGISSAEDLKTLNGRVLALKEETYNGFLKGLGLEPVDYPIWGGEKTKTEKYARLNSDWLRRYLEQMDFSRPIQFNGQDATFGLEAEFRGGHASKLITDKNGTLTVARERFPFLDPDAKKEGTGNYEVRSIPTNNLLDLESYFRQVKMTLQGDLRGFHMHMRVPNSLYEEIGPDRVDGWLGRVGDAVMMWRLQYRMHFFALKTWSQTRNTPEGKSNRGTIRVQHIGDSLDIEIRGLMGAYDEIVDTTRLILTGFKNPELIKGFTDFQYKTFVDRESLIEDMNQYLERYEGRKATTAEVEVLKKLETEATHNSVIWPLMRLDESPYLDDYQKKTLADKKFEFVKSVRTVLKNAMDKKYSNDAELFKQFRWRIKRWAQTLDMHSVLMSSLLMPPETRDDYKLSKDEIKRILESENLMDVASRRSNEWAKQFTTDELVELAFRLAGKPGLPAIHNALSEKGPGIPANAIQRMFRNDKLAELAVQILATGRHPKTEEILSQALASRNKNLVLRAARTISQLRSPSLRLVKIASQSPHSEVRAFAAAALKHVSGWEQAQPFAQKAMNDPSPDVRAKAALAAAQFPASQANERFNNFFKALGDSNEGVRERAFEMLSQLPYKDISPAVKKIVMRPSDYPAGSGEKAMKAWVRFVERNSKDTPTGSKEAPAHLVAPILELEKITDHPLLSALHGQALLTINMLPPKDGNAFARQRLQEGPQKFEEYLNKAMQAPSFAFEPDVQKAILDSAVKNPQDSNGSRMTWITSRAFSPEIVAPYMPSLLRGLDPRYLYSINQPFLIQMLAQDHTRGVRILNAIPREESGYPYLSFMLPLLRDTDFATHSIVTTRLTARLLGDKDEMAAKFAYQALKKAGGVHLLAALEEALSLQSPRAVTMASKLAAETVGKLQLGESAPLVTTLLERVFASNNANAALRLAGVLNQLDMETLRPILERNLNPMKPRHIRLAIVSAIAQRKTPVAASLLRLALADPDERIRALAERAPGAASVKASMTPGSVREVRCQAVFMKR